MPNALRVILLAVALVLVLGAVLWWRSPDQFKEIMARFGGAGKATVTTESEGPSSPTILESAATALSSDLSKADAARLLYFMGCTKVKVVAVVTGVGAAGLGVTSSPNVALVFAVCQRMNGAQEVDTYTFWRDSEIGWFYVETNRKSGRIRLWTLKGYQEVTSP